MRRPAKTRLAGTTAAIPLLLLWCGAATSQTPPAAAPAPSEVVVEQFQDGEVFADQQLHVVSVSEHVSSVAVGTGNSAYGGTESGDLDLTQSQVHDADVTANALVHAKDYVGGTTSLTSTAVGNVGHVQVKDGVLQAGINQEVGVRSLTATARLHSPKGTLTDATGAAQVIANSQSTALDGGAAGVGVRQSSYAELTADGGAEIYAVPGTAAFTAGALANDVTAQGTGSAQNLVVDQVSGGGRIAATQATALGVAQTAYSTVTSVGNNVTADNDSGVLMLKTSQDQAAYVRSQAGLVVDGFGEAGVSAYGVGNSVLAGNYGAELELDNRQYNEGGGVESVAELTGSDGYDATASATAMGNSVTGYACADCYGRVGVTSSQINHGGVAAQSVVNVPSGRSVAGSASAVGNAATFYVSRPGGAH